MCVYVCLSARPPGRLEQLGSHWTDFDEAWYLCIFRKSVEKIQVSLKSENKNGYFTWRLFTFMTISHSVLLRMRDVLHKRCRENQNTHFMFNNFFFRKSCRLWDNIEKCGGARGRRWQYGGSLHAGLVILHARKHTPAPLHPHPHTHSNTIAEICKTFFFSTATVVSWTRLCAKLYTYFARLVIEMQYFLWGR